MTQIIFNEKGSASNFVSTNNNIEEIILFVLEYHELNYFTRKLLVLYREKGKMTKVTRILMENFFKQKLVTYIFPDQMDYFNYC